VQSSRVAVRQLAAWQDPGVRKVFVIGIGAGDPEQVTVQAIRAMNRVDVFFVLDKGAVSADLGQLRKEICERYATERPYRVVDVPDPPRDRSAEAYRSSVEGWHAQRADIYAHIIRDELKNDESGAFLVWGDPSLYDSTLRVIDQVLASGAVAFEYEVIPGVTSIQTLAAKHRLPLNGIGEGILITTGRRLAEDWARGIDNVRRALSLRMRWPRALWGRQRPANPLQLLSIYADTFHSLI